MEHKCCKDKIEQAQSEPCCQTPVEPTWTDAEGNTYVGIQVDIPKKEPVVHEVNAVFPVPIK